MRTQHNTVSPPALDNAVLARLGVTLDNVGQPRPWSTLIRNPIQRDLECTAKILADIDKPKVQDYLAQLARRELWYVSAFLNSLQIPFFFVAWDHQRSVVVQCCGPDLKSVLSLLSHQPVTGSTTDGPANDRLDQIWQSAQFILDELRLRDGISFSLAWNPHYGRIPEFNFSGYDRQVSWNALWQSLPLVDRCRISQEPPPRPTEFEEQRIEPAVPSTLESGIQGIAWPEFQQHNIDRRLDWRWCRAFSLIRNEIRFNPKWDDAETGSAVEFLRALLRNPQTLASLAERMPDLFAAHEIITGPFDQRLELESRLLARQSSEELAEQLSISPAAVDAYHDTFFDVRARLDAKTYIIKKVICPDSGLGSHPLTLEGLAKQVAYLAGPVALNAILPYLKDNGRELAQHTGTDENPTHDPLAERLDLLLRAQSLPEDNKTSVSLVKVVADLIQGLPEYRPTQRWVGAFSQIVSPFEGEVTSSAGALKTEESGDKQAA
jgi:hypothetical protein